MKTTTKQQQRNLDFAETMIKWWAGNGRDFPWRKIDDPFRLLVAEIMLQRSRAGSVAKAYLILFERWDGPDEIAQASIKDLEAVMAPLGLPSRAARLKALASKWCESEDTPDSAKELLELPGVGPYTANATAIAMSWESDPCVDSVSIRVLRRFLGMQSKKLSDQRVASRAYSGIPRDRWRDLNWAILDLASALCMPSIPRCESCPLYLRCKWAEKQRQKPV